MRQPIIAIDGPAGSGKTTVARLVAERAGLQFVGSGAMYRAVALLALRGGVAAADRERLVAIAAGLPIRFAPMPDGALHTFLDDEDVTDALQSSAVAQVASALALIPELRAHLVAKQREYAQEGGMVMEGRDIQTVVFPDADIKVFLMASAEERACRRWKELVAGGAAVSYLQVLHELRTRDRNDSEREVAPLRPAPDAVLVDTERCTVEQVVTRLLRLVDAWRADPALRGEALARAAGCGRGAG